MTTRSKLDKHFLKHYDEKQLLDMYRISCETMLFTFVLITINGLIKMIYRPWAVASTEAATLILIPLTYFAIRSVLSEAYFSRQTKSYKWTFVWTTSIGILSLVDMIIGHLVFGHSIIEDGVLSGYFYNFFLSVFLLSVPITYFIKKVIVKKVGEDEYN